MTQPHDFEAALAAFKSGKWDFVDSVIIENALAFTIKMLGEPSDGMLGAAFEVTRSEWSDPVAHFNSHFKAMTSQAMKEVEDGQ